MGIIRDTIGDTIGQSSGCAIVAMCLLPAACVAMVVNAKHEQRAEAAREQAAAVQSCSEERAVSDRDAIEQCQTAASMFGQDISDNTDRLSGCLENHQRKIAQCEAKGL